ncbi:MAG: hypothetical protein V4650_01035 [Pseudomonadota bacterium]
MTETGRRAAITGLLPLAIAGYLTAIASLLLHRGEWARWLGDESALTVMSRSALLEGAWLLAIFGIGTLLRRHQRFAELAPAVFWGLLAVALLWLPPALLQSSAVVDGLRHFWLIDDEMISMTYARHLAEGQGLVWSAGERVEGFSNPAWTLLMAAVLLVAPLHIAPLVMLLLSIGVGLALVVLTQRLVRLLGGGDWAAAASVALLVFAPYALALASAGWESVPLAGLTLWCLCRILEEHGKAPRLGTGLLLGLIATVRADAATISLVLGLFWWLGSGQRGRAFAWGALGLLLPLAVLGFRLAYYGEWMSNTVVLKTANWPDRTATGLAYIKHYLKHLAPVLALALWAAWRQPRLAAAMILTLAAALIAQTTLAGGDTFGHYRMLFPVLMPLVVLAFTGVEHGIQNFWLRLAAPLACLLATSMILPGLLPRFGVVSPADAGNVRLALELKKHCGQDAVADFFAGTPFYYSGCRGVDLLGKMDRHVAALPVDAGSTHPGHNKFDYDWSLGRLKPALVVAPEPGSPTPAQLDDMAAEGWRYPLAFYGHPLFVQHCAPYPIAAQTWRTVYRCHWPATP